MFSFKKSKKTIHIEIKDYVVRIAETGGNMLSPARLFAEKPLPSGLIQSGKITDEIKFYDFMTALVKEFGLKNRQTRFIVPNALVIMRGIDIPIDLNSKKEMLEYVELEIGNSIHLPIQDPVFDITNMQLEASAPEQEIAETRQVTLFAAPDEEMRKYAEIFADVSLKPVAADIGILGDYRYFHHGHQVRKDHVYMFVEFNMASVYLGIFRGHQLEFLRYQDLDVNLKAREDYETKRITWKYVESDAVIQGLIQEQVNELENIMNFYRFSLSKGEHAVTDIIVLGDHPDLHMIYNRIVQQYEIPAVQLKAHFSQKRDQTIDSAFIPVLGLALEGDA